MNTEPLPEWTGQAKQAARRIRAGSRCGDAVAPQPRAAACARTGAPARAAAVVRACRSGQRVRGADRRGGRLARADAHRPQPALTRRQRRHLRQRSGHDVERRRPRVLRRSRFLRMARRAGKGQQRLSTDSDGSVHGSARCATGPIHRRRKRRRQALRKRATRKQQQCGAGSRSDRLPRRLRRRGRRTRSDRTFRTDRRRQESSGETTRRRTDTNHEHSVALSHRGAALLLIAAACARQHSRRSRKPERHGRRSRPTSSRCSKRCTRTGISCRRRRSSA